MQTIFFLKTAKAEATASNSLVLRFKLVETGKPKVKGLGISCPSKDWNQDDQQVRRSHPQFKKHNDQLKFIADELTEIEKVRNVTGHDIDTIVAASIKGISVKELEHGSQLLSSMIMEFREHQTDNPAYSENYRRRMKSVSNLLAKIEKAIGYQISANNLNSKSNAIQNDIVKYFRKLGKKDSTAKGFITNANACIGHFNKVRNQSVKHFTKKDTKWAKSQKDIIALNTDELKLLYNFAYNRNPESPKPFIAELRNIRYFLFRCFCGMRIGDMNKSNINPDRLKKDSSTFSYLQDKGTKNATVYCIGTYLYDIAESLNWEFPDFESDTALFSYSTNETQAVRKHLTHLLKDNMRKIQHITDAGQTFTNLSEEVTTHTARKTFAHLLYSLTKDIMLVKNQLGHTKIETTMRYLDFNMDGNSDMLKNVNLGF